MWVWQVYSHPTPPPTSTDTCPIPSDYHTVPTDLILGTCEDSTSLQRTLLSTDILANPDILGSLDMLIIPDILMWEKEKKFRYEK